MSEVDDGGEAPETPEDGLKDIPLVKLARVYRKMAARVQELTKAYETEVEGIKAQQDALKMAIKDQIEAGQRGIRISHLLNACIDEFKENEDLPNTTNPDDWARISGKKGERIVYIRTLVTGKQGVEPGRAIENIGNTGQYL